MVDTTLKYETPIEWAENAIKDLPKLLQDHANAERKVANICMSFAAKYADRTEIISDLAATAIEEIAHFRQVFELMKKRNIPLTGKIPPDPYSSGFMDWIRHGRDERFLDRLLFCSILEYRGVERFKLLSEAMEDEELKKFYARLSEQEKNHGILFVKMAAHYFDEETIAKRYDEMLTKEAEIIQSIPWSSSIH